MDAGAYRSWVRRDGTLPVSVHEEMGAESGDARSRCRRVRFLVFLVLFATACASTGGTAAPPADHDGQADLALFFTSDSDTTEAGLFTLDLTRTG